MTASTPSVADSTDRRLSTALEEVSRHIRALKPYIPGKPIEEVKRELGLTGEIVKLASNENPLGPPPSALAALRDALPRLSQYPDGGCHDLRMAVARKLGVPADGLVFGNGSDEIIHLLGLTFLQPGDEVVVGDPTFVLYEAAATLAGAVTVKVPLTRPDYAHDPQAMADAFTDRTRLVFIANPHNPTGSRIGRDAVDHLLARLPARALLILDEAYGEYVYGTPGFPAALEYIASGAPVIGLRTFSKMYGLAGLRVGYAVAHPEAIRALNQSRSPFNVNLAGQVAATAAIDDDAFVEAGKRANAAGMTQLIAGFDRLGLRHIPSFTNFVMFDTDRPCRAVFEALLRQGVIVRTGDIFGMPTFLRVTIGTEAQNARFLSALEAVLPGIAPAG
ncbi:MAG: histidinol-phosphate transaminase [Capsulimonadales bacterium]|nr:histidinol-phosphate transaminase [Capsulimonadales bacterium]